MIGALQAMAEVVKSELETAFALVEVKPKATDDEVQHTRRKMMERYHPDLHPNETEKYNHRRKAKFSQLISNCN
jgi:DnaJ-class molecular chaperone